MLARDWRGGELGVLLVALVLAVGVVSGISAFATRLQNALTQESHRFLAADLVARSSRALPGEWLQGAAQRGVATARTLGASDKQIVLKVLLPLALPGIFRSLRSLFGLAFGYIMLAELINAPQGLGAMLNVSQRRGLTEHIFLILLVIGLLAWTIDHSLGWLEKKLFPYRQ